MPKPIKERAGILQVLAPDGVNTMPVSYMTLDDNGIELYYAGLYIDKLPVEAGLLIVLPGSSIWTMLSLRSS